MGHLGSNDILTDRHHGFRAKRSTETQLQQTVRDFTSDKEKGSDYIHGSRAPNSEKLFAQKLLLHGNCLYQVQQQR